MNPQEASLSSAERSRPHPKSGLRPIFVGPNGPRAGWRLLIFVAIFVVLQLSAAVVIHRLHPSFLDSAATTLTPMAVGVSEGLAFLFLCIASLIMARIEHRKFSDYGLPLRLILRKNFWLGALWGFLAISSALLAMSLLHGFRITGLAIHGTTILTATLTWSIACLIIGLCEEYLLRGYPLFTLSTGMGFWPAAFVVSAAFALLHAPNKGETVSGLLSVMLFGLLFCLFIRRSGNLWLAVGFHAGFDWGQTFFYGVHDSGILPNHNLFASEFSGPNWLTGGSVGPEASIFVSIALGIVALLFNLRYRDVRYQAAAASKQPERNASAAVATT